VLDGGSINILIADDSEVVRRAVKDLLNTDSGTWEVCGEVDNGADALEQAAKLLPDVILLDLSIPAVDGLTVAQTLKKEYPAMKVILMSEQDDSVLSRLATAAGTPYYILKSQLAQGLIPLLLSLGAE
jgi:DNA-binding NarL/FixJ family response regulator